MGARAMPGELNTKSGRHTDMEEMNGPIEKYWTEKKHKKEIGTIQGRRGVDSLLAPYFVNQD